MPDSSLKHNFFFNAIYTASNALFSLLVFMYVSHVLLPDGRGKVAFAASVTSYFTMVAMLGIPTYGIRITAQLRDDKERLSRAVQELLIINAVMSVVSCLVFLAATHLVPRLREEPLLFLIHSALVLFSFTCIDWLYKGLEQYRFLAVLTVIYRMVYLALVVLMVRKPSDYIVYGALTVFGPLFVYLVYMVHAGRFISLRPLGGYHFREHLNKIMVFFAMVCAVSVYTHLDTTMLGFLKTDTDVGYYTVAVQVKTLLVSVVTSLGAVLMPRASYYIEQKKWEEFHALGAKGLHFVILFAAPLVLYFLLFAKEGILFLSGASYLPSVVPMRIIMPALMLIGLTNILGIQMLVPLGREKMVFYSVLTGAAVDFVLNLIWIPRYAASGAAAGTVVAEFAVLVVQVLALRKEFFSAMRKIPFAQIALALAAGVLCAFSVKKWGTVLLASWQVSDGSTLHSFLTLLFSALLFFGAYLVVLCFSHEPIVKEAVAYVRTWPGKNKE